jgi:hypothetical protein
MAMGGGVVIESPPAARAEALARLARVERAHAPLAALAKVRA